MTSTEAADILRQLNDHRRGCDVPSPKPSQIGRAIDAVVDMIERLELAEKERGALQAKVEAMEKQEPVAWCATDETGTVIEALGMNQSRRFDTALYLAPGARPTQKAVAYLDLGVGGYMDIGTDLTDEQLASLPKRRHILGIVGTYGVDGYVSAQPAPSVRPAALYPVISWLRNGCDPMKAADELEMLAAAPEAKP